MRLTKNQLERIKRESIKQQNDHLVQEFGEHCLKIKGKQLFKWIEWVTNFFLASCTLLYGDKGAETVTKKHQEYMEKFAKIGKIKAGDNGN